MVTTVMVRPLLDAMQFGVAFDVPTLAELSFPNFLTCRKPVVVASPAPAQ